MRPGVPGESPLAKAPPFRTLHERYPVENLSEALAEGIRTGHPAMPQFDALDAEQIDDLIAYLKSLEDSRSVACSSRGRAAFSESAASRRRAAPTAGRSRNISPLPASPSDLSSSVPPGYVTPGITSASETIVEPPDTTKRLVIAHRRRHHRRDRPRRRRGGRRRRRAPRATAFRDLVAHPAGERAAILHRIADGVEKRIEELAQVETRDNGSLLRSHRRGVMPRVAHELPLLRRPPPAARTTTTARPAATATTSPGTRPASPRSSPPGTRPLMLATWRIAPALAAGNTVVAKPPEWAPLTASLLADIAAEAGPAGRRVQRRPGHWAPRRARPRRRTRACGGSASPAGPHGQRIGAARGPNVTPVSLRARRQVAAARVRRRRPRPRRRPRGRAVRQLGPGLPGRGPDPGAGARSPTSSPRLPGQAGAGAGQGDPRDEATTSGRSSARRTSSAWTASCGGRSRTAPSRCSAAAHAELNDASAAPTTGRRCSSGAEPASEILCRGGVRPGPHAADVPRARPRGSRWPTTPSTASPRPWSPATPERAERVAAAAGRRHRLGQLLLRPRPRARRSAATASPASAARAAPGVRLLLRRQEHRLRTEADGAEPMGEVVGAGLLAHVPTIMLPEADPAGAQRRRGLLASSLACERLRREVFDTLDYDTVVVLDSHWATTVEFVVTAQDRRAGLFTSEELPRGMCRDPLRLAAATPSSPTRWRTPRRARHLDHRDRRPVPADLLRHRQPLALPGPRPARQAVDLRQRLPDRRHGGLPARRPGARRRHRGHRPHGRC